jgi:hypothetical protein
MRTWPLALLAAAVAACSGTDTTGPVPTPPTRGIDGGQPPSAPPGSTANVAGTWTFTISNLTGGGVTCNLADTPMTLTQSGTAFSGTYGPGSLSCTGPSGLQSGLVQGYVIHGTVNGLTVAFDLDTPDAHHTGTSTGSLMSGTATYRVSDGSGAIVILSGSWSASRQ